MDDCDTQTSVAMPYHLPNIKVDMYLSEKRELEISAIKCLSCGGMGLRRFTAYASDAGALLEYKIKA